MATDTKLRKKTIGRLAKVKHDAKRAEHAALVVRAWLANSRPHFEEVLPAQVHRAEVSNYTVVGGFNDPSGEGYWVTINMKVGDLDIERAAEGAHTDIREALAHGRLK